MWIGREVASNVLQDLFGVPSLEAIPGLLVSI
jgi:hypothetical protein